MAEETSAGSIGTARIDVTVNTATMEAGVEAAKRRVSGLGTEAEAQFNKASASGKRYADSLLRQAEMLGKTRAEQIAYNAQTRIGGELGDKIAAKALAQQAAMAKGLDGTAKTARELAFATRGLPAQITDIFTSLASGQRPTMVLLQQGGQLKDMFGGIGPAAKALGSSLLGLINPYTLTAGAVAALGAAWVSAENDASAFNKALIVTGNYAGKTASQLEAMVGSIATTADATQGSAREALQKVAQTGRFTGEQFDLVAQAAARMESATGQSIDDTIKKFEEIAKAPVEGLLKLNETEHFLTEAQLERVQALIAEGKEQEAAAEAARIYASRLDDVGDAAEAARPHLSQMWKEAKEGGSKALAEAKSFVEFLAAAAEKQQKMPWYQRISPVGGLRSSLSALYGAEPAAQANVAPVAGAVDSTAAKAGIELQKEAAKFKDRYLTREQEKKREIAELDKLRAQYSEQEYQSLKKQIELKFTDKGAAKQAKFFDQSITGDTHADLTTSIGKEIDGYKKVFDQQSKNTVGLMQYTAAMDARIKTDREAAQLQIESIGLGQHQIEIRSKIIDIERGSNRDLEKLNHEFADKSFHMTQDDYDARLKVIKEKEAERVQIVMETDRQIAAARGDASLGAKAAIADFQYAADDVAGQTYSVWSNSLQGMTDELADFFTTGKANWKDFAQDVLKQIAKIQIAKALAGIASSFAGNTNTVSGYDRATPQQQVAYDVAHGYAKGGVFANSPSLSAYSGGVYDKPQMFAFARGAGIFGEAGPEAIMPLRRGPDGKLGVAAAGGSGGDVQVEVNITNNGQAVQAQQTGTRRDGQKVIVDMVLDAVASDIATGGRTSKAMQQRYGLQRRGVPVGG